MIIYHLWLYHWYIWITRNYSSDYCRQYCLPEEEPLPIGYIFCLPFAWQTCSKHGKECLLEPGSLKARVGFQGYHLCYLVFSSLLQWYIFFVFCLVRWSSFVASRQAASTSLCSSVGSSCRKSSQKSARERNGEGLADGPLLWAWKLCQSCELETLFWPCLKYPFWVFQVIWIGGFI